MLQQLLGKLTKEEITLLFAVLGGFGVLAAAVVTSVFAIIQAIIAKRSDEKKHLRELSLTLALEQWKREVAQADAKNSRWDESAFETGMKKRATARPLRVIMFQQLRFVDDVCRGGLTAAKLGRHLRETRTMLEEAAKIESAKT